MASQKEIEERRAKVEQMIIQGVAHVDIRVKLNLSRGTFYRDLEKIQRKNAEMETWNQEEEIAGALATLEAIEYEAWESYERATPGSNQAIGALNTIAKTRKQRVKMMVDIGVIDKVPDKVKHEIESFEDKVKKLRKEKGLPTEETEEDE